MGWAQDWRYNLWGPVPNQNAKPLVQILLRILGQQLQAFNQVWGPVGLHTPMQEARAGLRRQQRTGQSRGAWMASSGCSLQPCQGLAAIPGKGPSSRLVTLPSLPLASSREVKAQAEPLCSPSLWLPHSFAHTFVKALDKPSSNRPSGPCFRSQLGT